MGYCLCKSGTCNYYTSDHLGKDMEFCPTCGSKLVKKCPECSADIKSENNRFCTQCGARLKDEPPKRQTVVKVER